MQVQSWNRNEIIPPPFSLFVNGGGQVGASVSGGTRLAIRKGETLSYLLADHIGSTSLTTDASGVRTSELRYKAFGETRFSYGTMPTEYQFTGQYAYTDDPSTLGVTEGFGLMYFNARWMDPSLGRFTSPDTVVPGGTQGYDRYAFVGNNPVNRTDPTGHKCVAADGEDGACLKDDGTRGAGFTGVASANSGFSSNDIKGCAGNSPRDCGGNPRFSISATTPNTKNHGNVLGPPLPPPSIVVLHPLDSNIVSQTPIYDSSFVPPKLIGYYLVVYNKDGIVHVDTSEL
jgi:RHS repeat-associated protein